MDLQEKMLQISERMCTLKTDWVASYPEQTDLGIYLHFYRGDEMVIAVACQLDKDIALKAAHLGAAGFGADTTTISFESYHTELEKSPITGESWQPGEMERVMTDDPDAQEKGWVHECITTTAHERGGKYGLISMPYLIKEGEVVWQDSVIPPEGVEGGGYMFDSLQHSMAQPTLIEHAAEAAKNDPLAKLMLGLIDDPELRQFHTDMATLQALREGELIISAALSVERGADRERWIRERFGQQDEA